MEQQMTERTIWQELNACPLNDLIVIYDHQIALVDDGEHVWIANSRQLMEAIQWASVTPAESAHEAYASFWGRCPGWIVEDLREGDEFPLDIYQCIHALTSSGFETLIPKFWGRDEEAF